MTSRRKVLQLGLSVGVLGLVSAPGTARSEEGLHALLLEFRTSPGISARFSEKKQIALLAAPLLSEGNVYFLPSGSSQSGATLARIVKKPHPSHVVLTPKSIVVADAGGRREVDLSDKPELRALLSSLLHVLGGDEGKLKEDYEVGFTGRAREIWALQLKPRSAALKALLEGFEFKGKGLALTELRVKEASGDVSVSTFTEVNEARKFSREEIAKLFRP